MMRMIKSLLLVLLQLVGVTMVNGAIKNYTDFTVTNATVGTTLSTTKYPTNYTCTLVSKWSASRQPINFPANPTFFTPILVAASSSYQLWAPKATATQGLNSMVTTGATDRVINEINSNGDIVIDYQEGSQQSVSILGFQTLPPIKVDRDHSYLTSITPLSPSPDWFHGFYQFNTIDTATNTFYDAVSIDVYPWDLGTQTGATYLDSVSPINPYDPIFEFTVDTVPSTKVFLDPTRTTVLPVATWTCILQVGNNATATTATSHATTTTTTTTTMMMTTTMALLVTFLVSMVV